MLFVSQSVGMKSMHPDHVGESICQGLIKMLTASYLHVIRLPGRCSKQANILTSEPSQTLGKIRER